MLTAHYRTACVIIYTLFSNALYEYTGKTYLYEERCVEDIFDSLCKGMWIYHKFKEAYWALVVPDIQSFQDVMDLFNCQCSTFVF